MCAKVVEVEHALEDVKELLSTHQPPSNSEREQGTPSANGWEREWVKIVQDVVEKDAGWK